MGLCVAGIREGPLGCQLYPESPSLQSGSMSQHTGQDPSSLGWMRCQPCSSFCRGSPASNPCMSPGVHQHLLGLCAGGCLSPEERTPFPESWGRYSVPAPGCLVIKCKSHGCARSFPYMCMNHWAVGRLHLLFYSSMLPPQSFQSNYLHNSKIYRTRIPQGWEKNLRCK